MKNKYCKLNSCQDWEGSTFYYMFDNEGSFYACYNIFVAFDANIYIVSDLSKLKKEEIDKIISKLNVRDTAYLNKKQYKIFKYNLESRVSKNFIKRLLTELNKHI